MAHTPHNLALDHTSRHTRGTQPQVICKREKWCLKERNGALALKDDISVSDER